MNSQTTKKMYNNFKSIQPKILSNFNIGGIFALSQILTNNVKSNWQQNIWQFPYYRSDPVS